MIEINCKNCNQKIIVENRRTKLCLECKKNKKLERCKNYKRKNKELISNYNKNYKQKNKDTIKVYNKNYNINNRESIQKKQTIQHKERKKTDNNYKICEDLRKKFTKFLKTNNKKKISIISKLVGCCSINFKKWIEFNFDEKMTWDNYNEYWQIDHIICCNYFNFEIEHHKNLCFNWKNTRPLNKIINLSRQDVSIDDLLKHENNIKRFLEYNKHDNDEYDIIDYDFEYLITKLKEKSI
jgi:hypothetical protein